MSGLQARLIASLIIMLCTTLTVMGYVLVRDADRRIENFQHRQAHAQANALAEGSVDALITEEYELLERWVKSVLPSKEYAYAALVKPDGLVLVHTNIDMTGRNVETLQPTKHHEMRNFTLDGRPITEMIHPVKVGAKHLANAHVAYYLDMGHGISNESIPWIISAIVLTLIVLSIGSLVITRKLINPLNYLAKEASAVSYDNPLHLDGKILLRKDEVGTLANSFCNMSARLFEAYQALKKKSDELELRVEERTQQLNEILQELEHKNQLLTDNNQRLAHVATHDALTGIPNRMLFNDRLKETISEAKQANRTFTVTIMDLNKFKPIHDNDGHLIGDQVLKEIAARLSVAFGTGNTVARLGGDEFALIIPDASIEEIPAVADKITEEIEKPITIDGREYTVGTSIGFSLFPEHGEDNSTLINSADFAMYKSKRDNISYAIYDMSLMSQLPKPECPTGTRKITL